MGAVFARAELGADVASRYGRDGYVAVPDVLSAREVAELRDEAVRICGGERGPIEGATPAAVGEDGEQLLRRYLCVHFPHKVSPVVLASMQHPRIVEVLTQLIGPDVKAMQSMLFIKREGMPGQAWHQDEFFIPTRDRSLTGVWIALDDATTGNGCLWVLPGSHAPGVLYPDREHHDERFDCTIEAHDFPYSDDDAVALEVTAGSVVFFNGYLLHRSLPNRTAHGMRRALVHHYMSAASLLPWMAPTHGVHVAKQDFRDIVMIAGRDPYAYKGTIDVMRPHLRPAGDGGCDR
jgi:phytanoyl-CoA hydroxylase